jgi:hypothetical protein
MGFYSSISGAASISTCQQCDAGKWTTLTGASSADLCEYFENTDQCLAWCADHTYSSGLGQQQGSTAFNGSATENKPGPCITLNLAPIFLVVGVLVIITLVAANFYLCIKLKNRPIVNRTRSTNALFGPPRNNNELLLTPTSSYSSRVLPSHTDVYFTLPAQDGLSVCLFLFLLLACPDFLFSDNQPLPPTSEKTALQVIIRNLYPSLFF